MSNVTIALFFGIGFAAWVYSKIYRSTGGNNRSSLVVAASSGFVLFLFVLIALNLIFN